MVATLQLLHDKSQNVSSSKLATTIKLAVHRLSNKSFQNRLFKTVCKHSCNVLYVECSNHCYGFMYLLYITK